MAYTEEELKKELETKEYEYGFVTKIDADTFSEGLNENVIRAISKRKEEPNWMTEWRLKAFNSWKEMEEPNWSNVKYKKPDFQKISYYSAPKSKDKYESLDEVDPELLKTFEKLGISISEQKKLTGVATVSWMLEHAAPLVKVTIVPRGQSLGAAWYLPEERQIVKTEQILDEMCAALGGRAAEKVMFNNISTGALSDLEKVTKQARSMVTVYGLNDKIGNLTYYDSSGQNDYSFTKPYSDVTAEIIDKEISNIIETQYQRAIKLLKKHKSKLIELANFLLEKEVIFKEDLVRIYGERPFDIKTVIKESKS